MSTTFSRSLKQFVCTLIAGIVLAVMVPVAAAATDAARPTLPCLDTARVLELVRYLSAAKALDSYARVSQAAFGAPLGDRLQITAFEENTSFVYAVGEARGPVRTASGEHSGQPAARAIRRLVILNSSVLIVDDEVAGAPSDASTTGCILSNHAPQLSGRRARISEAGGGITSEVLLPGQSAYRVVAVKVKGGPETDKFLLGVAVSAGPHAARILQVIRVGKAPGGDGQVRIASGMPGEDLQLTAMVSGRTYRLTLPAPSRSAGEVAVSGPDGKTLIAARPLPSGILPHGPEGNHLLDLWDSDYRTVTPARWDIGHAADELQKVVSEGRMARCRVVDLCCGAGSDAVYLASKGFDVTAIDVAPTALGLGQQRARKAGVQVKWMLADILAAPDLPPFDFLYDRGCYHVVRDQNLNAYLETVRRYSRPGSQFLLLAARRDEQARGGPPGVTEEELRFDFLSLFDVEWLRQIRLESNEPIGPPGWSALLKRRATP